MHLSDNGQTIIIFEGTQQIIKFHLKRSLKIALNYFLGPVVFIILCFSLYNQLSKQPDLLLRWQEIKTSWKQFSFWMVVVLAVVNWGIESKKWQLLVEKLQPISFSNAFKSVLAGCSITLLTPNRIGEYGGRVLFIDSANRIKAISLTIVGSISQLLVTLLAGCMSVLFLRFFLHEKFIPLSVLSQFWQDLFWSISLLLLLLTGFLYWKIVWVAEWLKKIRWLKKYFHHVQVLLEFNFRQLFILFSWSTLRYLVFITQYILLLRLMHIELSFMMCFALVAVFYLLMAVAPTIGFVELPLRITALWAILQWQTTNELGVGAAALSIWIINLAVPAIIGSFYILRARNLKVVK
jgi:hypothetical protein